MKDFKRYRLKEDEWKLVDEYRNDKKRQSLLADECNEVGIDLGSVSHYWYKSQKFSIFAKPNEYTKDDFYNLLRSLYLITLQNIPPLIILLDKMDIY